MSGRSHLVAVLQALFVTFLWSTSWVLIKVGLRDMPALTFAGLRYTLAFLCLLPLALAPRRRAALLRLSGRDWLGLAALGLLFYTITQGAQFVGLAYLPAVTVSLFLSFSPLAVVVLSIPLLSERPSPWQWGGVGLFLAGVLVYFYPANLPAGQVLGLAVVSLGVLANAGSSLLGRHVNRSRTLDPLLVTVVSMGIGAIVLLGTGLMVQKLPQLTLANWAVIAWLAVVNTALAFTLWNHTLRTLTATESSIINNTMLVQIAILAWLFLDEPISRQALIGLALAAAGALIVQMRRPSNPPAHADDNGDTGCLPK